MGDEIEKDALEAQRPVTKGFRLKILLCQNSGLVLGIAIMFILAKYGGHLEHLVTFQWRSSQMKSSTANDLEERDWVDQQWFLSYLFVNWWFRSVRFSPSFRQRFCTSLSETIKHASNSFSSENFYVICGLRILASGLLSRLPLLFFSSVRTTRICLSLIFIVRICGDCHSFEHRIWPRSNCFEDQSRFVLRSKAKEHQQKPKRDRPITTFTHWKLIHLWCISMSEGTRWYQC